MTDSLAGYDEKHVLGDIGRVIADALEMARDVERRGVGAQLRRGKRKWARMLGPFFGPAEAGHYVDWFLSG